MEIYDTISPNLLPMRTKHTNHTNNNFQPLELFYNFFDDSLIIKICENSNKYRKYYNEQHKEITKEERLDFIFINIYFSVIYLPEKEMFSNCNSVKTHFL